MTRNACLVIVMLLSGLPPLLAADALPKWVVWLQTSN